METTEPQTSNQCPICFECMHHAEKTPCSHVFCTACLQKWRSKHATCPICRASLHHGPHITDAGFKAVMLLQSKLLGTPSPRTRRVS